MCERTSFVFLQCYAWLCAAVLLPTMANADAVYSIGNSLTNDMVPDYLPTMAADSGFVLRADYHIRSSASLSYMVNNPIDATFSRPANLDIAIPTVAYDFVTMEPYLGWEQSTLLNESTAIGKVISLAGSGPSSKAQFYIYEAWPNQIDTAGDYHSYWVQPVAADSSQPTRQARQFYDHLLFQVQTRFNGTATVFLIPIGDVFDKIAQDARAGLLPGVSDISQIYRDPVHMGDVGRFVAAMTVIATLYKQRPSATSSTVSLYQFGEGAARLTPELAAQLQSIVWDVVSNDVRTGVVVQGAGVSSSASSSSGSASANGGGAGDVGFLMALVALLLPRALFGYQKHTMHLLSQSFSRRYYQGTQQLNSAIANAISFNSNLC